MSIYYKHNAAIYYAVASKANKIDTNIIWRAQVNTNLTTWMLIQTQLLLVF